MKCWPVSFRNPTQVTVLYDETAAHLPAGRPVADAFPGDVDFAAAFDQLYPPMTVGKTNSSVTSFA